jgi:hypothetical protein
MVSSSCGWEAAVVLLWSWRRADEADDEAAGELLLLEAVATSDVVGKLVQMATGPALRVASILITG